MERALTLYAVLGSIFAIYIFAKGDFMQGRLTFGHPNYLGLISFGVLVCCLGIPSMLGVRVALIAINLYVIAQAQARACLLASVISILVYILLATSKVWGRRKGIVAATLVVIAI